MDFARRAAARADAGDIYGMRIPSPDAHMTIDELRWNLLQEGIRQQFILAELAKRWEMEAVFQRQLSLHGDVYPTPTFRQRTMPHRGTSPLPHGEQLDVPLSLAGASTSRQHIKDQTAEWYQPPRCRMASEEDAPIVGAKLCKKAVSRVKRKRTAETLSLICSTCDTECYSETDLENHLRGRRHQGNIEALQGGGKGTEEKMHEKKALQLADKSQKSISTWMCNTCNANCTSQSNLESHLRGKRHQENIEALQGEDKGTEAKLHDNILPQLENKKQKYVSRWICNICNANCTSQSNLESHLGGRRHEENIEALRGEGKGTKVKFYDKNAPQLVDRNPEPVPRWMCSICNANCTSQSDLESHLLGRRHQDNIEALQGERKGTEVKLYEKKAPQLADMNQIPVSRWMCNICNANCTSQSDLERHLEGRRHQENIEALQGVGKGTEAKLYEKNGPHLPDMNQKPFSRWMCSICSANCTSQSDLESHLGGRRHQDNIEALQGEGKGTEAKLYENNEPHLADINQKPSSKWMCSICNANCTTQSNLESHLGGRRHQENIEALQGEGKGTEAKLYKKNEPELADMNQIPVSRWICSICNANCTSQSDLERHLGGRRHQENIEPLQGVGKGTEAKLYEKNEPHLPDMNQKPSSRWMCSICNANCTSQSDLESHFGGRRHQDNIEALQGEGKGTETKLYEKNEPHLADMNQKPSSKWICSICNANCTSQSDLESHLRGRRHQENIEALQGEGKGTEAKLYKKNEPELADMNQIASSRWMCSICNANCTSLSDLESHLGGRRHRENIEALQVEGKGTEVKLYEKNAPQLVDRNQKPVSRWMCSICDANCTSQFDLENHLGGRRHQENIEALEGEGKGTEVKLYEKNEEPFLRWTCSICNANCTSQFDLESHLGGRRHQRNVQAQA